MRSTSMRISLAVVAVGLLIALGGMLLGGAPTYSSSSVQAPSRPEIIPSLGDEPDVVRGSPGSREQVALFGGMVATLGGLGVLASASSNAARRARETGPGPSDGVAAGLGPA